MGDGQNHPLRRNIDRPSKHPDVIRSWWRDPVLTCLEESLVLLEAAHPQGLDSMARTFGAFDDPSWAGVEQFLRHRAELVVASLLAEAQVPFRFNTAAGPDLLMGEEPSCMGIEISSRSPKSLFNLSQTLHEGLRDRGLAHSVSIRTDPIPPVAIRTEVRNAIIEQILPADGSPGVRSLRVMAAPARPEDGIPESWVTITLGGSGTTMTSAPLDSPHMIAMARDVAKNVLRERRKIRQSQTMPTLLIVEVSGADLPDLRSWKQAFDRIWEEQDAFLGMAAMVASSNRRLPTFSFSINPYADTSGIADLVARLSGCPSFQPLSTQLHDGMTTRDV
ncbi:hypothetical protein OOK36_54505 [Streptomyces sp. NBC_00365]|uniref:hypothetical protein n=1 Tax=Streptomyces sp. NBC_00365 TaxID=2975726 RepID=UPI0022506DCE|nr:hypothetical protein [Streptomyces sp. NBC_00365]MCX5097487.1 hypothetical protein [Streptomyces sp. NBC_00365]